MWAKIKDWLLGPMCAEAGCPNRSDGYATKVRTSIKGWDIITDPVPLCHKHLEEFIDAYDPYDR